MPPLLRVPAYRKISWVLKQDATREQNIAALEAYYGTQSHPDHQSGTGTNVERSSMTYGVQHETRIVRNMFRSIKLINIKPTTLTRQIRIPKVTKIPSIVLISANSAPRANISWPAAGLRGIVDINPTREARQIRIPAGLRGILDINPSRERRQIRIPRGTREILTHPRNLLLRVSPSSLWIASV